MAKNLMQRNTLLPSIKEGLSKNQISALVTSAIDRVMEQGNVFQVVEAVSVMEEFIKGFRKDNRFVDYLREELIKNNGNFTTKAGARIETCEVGVIYDYSNDLRWLELEQQINDLTEVKKKLEEKLRRIPSGKSIVDADTGEVFIGPPKSSKSSYKVTLSKG